jgi:hypothetical protein
LADLAVHFALLTEEFEAAKIAPLSARKAMLVAMLIDAYADRLFAAQSGEDDILAFRARLAANAPALGLVFELCALRAEGARLVIEAVDVPLADYGGLEIEDFMVSLYNDHAVQRVRIALLDGSRRDVHEVLAEAIAAFGQPVAARNCGGN